MENSIANIIMIFSLGSVTGLCISTAFYMVAKVVSGFFHIVSLDDERGN